MRHNQYAPTSFKLQRLLLILVPMISLLAGCSYMVNPFEDQMPSPASITTVSAERVREAGVTNEAPRTRGWTAETTYRQNPCVTHWPLWFSDSFEDKGSEDGQFAWTWEDYFAVAYCPTRQAVNFAALPISAIVDPIWSVQCSDGEISPQTFGQSNHDASPL